MVDEAGASLGARVSSLRRSGIAVDVGAGAEAEADVDVELAGDMPGRKMGVGKGDMSGGKGMRIVRLSTRVNRVE